MADGEDARNRMGRSAGRIVLLCVIVIVVASPLVLLAHQYTLSVESGRGMRGGYSPSDILLEAFWTNPLYVAIGVSRSLPGALCYGVAVCSIAGIWVWAIGTYVRKGLGRLRFLPICSGALLLLGHTLWLIIEEGAGIRFFMTIFAVFAVCLGLAALFSRLVITKFFTGTSRRIGVALVWTLLCAPVLLGDFYFSGAGCIAIPFGSLVIALPGVIMEGVAVQALATSFLYALPGLLLTFGFNMGWQLFYDRCRARLQYIDSTISGNDLEATDALLAVDPELARQKNENQWTPLHRAAYLGELDEVRLLVYHQPDVNQEVAGGSTALHFAAWRGHTEIVKLLLDNYVDVNHLDKGNKTPLDWADTENRALIELLESHGAKHGKDV